MSLPLDTKMVFATYVMKQIISIVMEYRPHITDIDISLLCMHEHYQNTDHYYAIKPSIIIISDNEYHCKSISRLA